MSRPALHALDAQTAFPARWTQRKSEKPSYHHNDSKNKVTDSLECSNQGKKKKLSLRVLAQMTSWDLLSALEAGLLNQEVILAKTTFKQFWILISLGSHTSFLVLEKKKDDALVSAHWPRAERSPPQLLKCRVSFYCDLSLFFFSFLWNISLLLLYLA